ncbi:Heterokaryon incompatibility [Fusarium oxysporum f. sp. vasinfectum]|nr:Heterokaryon incompatibility [Fusarium oxysporum f. sp. vasinfectum]
MPSLNRYFYEPLSAQDAVRLIVLYPATDQEVPLTCSIIQHRLSTQALGYYAVSYAWGKHQFSATLEIKCDGTSSSSLRITPNVDALLRCLRASDETRCWWIDAICLDQENDAEKAEQIPAMGRIFAQAQQVHIWLGPEDEVTAKIFKFFRKVSQLPDMNQAEMEKRVTILMIYKLCRTGIRERDRLAEFFNRSWFSRRWVIQEACLAREAVVHCGRYSSPLPLLSLAATRIQNTDIASYPIKMMANLQRPVMELSILELLWNFHDAICLEPKDRVAALFGLVSEDNQFRLDYSLHWTELYRQVAVSAFSSNNNDVGLQVLLHLFEFGQVFEQDNASYPSWVPDWRKSRRRLLPYNSRVKGTDTHENYPASPGQSEKAILNFQDNTLQVHWNASTGGPRGRRVIFARTFNSLPHDAGYKPKQSYTSCKSSSHPSRIRSRISLHCPTYSKPLFCFARTLKTEG